MTARSNSETHVGGANPHSYRVLGIRVDGVAADGAKDFVERSIESQAKTYLVFSTVSSILCARDDERVRAAVEGAGLVAPDGMPLVWIGRRRSQNEVDRVYGPDFMSQFITTSGSTRRHFFYGGAPGVAEEMARRLQQRVPGLVVAGTLCPQVVSGDTVLAEDVERINAAKPDVVWVGLGHPKQELWMKAHRDSLDAPVLAGVGAAFDYLSGRKPEAPEWMKRSGLQWAHRLASEPRRLFKRYVFGNARFSALLLRESLRGQV